MNGLREKYKEILQTYLDQGNEEALYKANELSKEFVHQAIAPEELVVFHHDVVQELTDGLPPEAALKLINSCLAYLVEVMVTYGINYGQVWASEANVNRWHDAVLRLSASLSLFKSKHKQILDTIPVGVITVNRDGVVTFANHRLESLGIQPDKVIGQKLVDVAFHGKKFSAVGNFTSLLIETLETGKVFNDVEKEYPNGLVLQISTAPIYDKEGKITEVIASIQDATGRKQLEKTIFNQEKLAAVGTLAAGIAHEIRNPLTSVRGFIQLLEPELRASKKREFLEIILDEIDRANCVLNDFLGFARPASPKRQKVELLKLLEEIRILTESEAILRDVSLEFVYPNVRLGLHIDKAQIKQVLLNMIKNALDAVRAAGWVRVSTQWDPGSKDVLIMIEDNGIGMDQEIVTKIFDPFFTTKDTGTGLGMAVTYQIIKNHGGEITVKSQPRVGTTFTITLPVAEEIKVSTAC